MMEWEYKVRTIKHGVIIEDVLNEYGADGWELTTSLMQFEHVVVYLKRPKSKDKYGK